MLTVLTHDEYLFMCFLNNADAEEANKDSQGSRSPSVCHFPAPGVKARQQTSQ